MCGARTICHILAVASDSLEEGGFAEVHFHGNRLPRGIGQRQVARLEEDNGRAVAAKRGVREGIYLRAGSASDGRSGVGSRVGGEGGCRRMGNRDGKGDWQVQLLTLSRVDVGTPHRDELNVRRTPLRLLVSRPAARSSRLAWIE